MNLLPHVLFLATSPAMPPPSSDLPRRRRNGIARFRTTDLRGNPGEGGSCLMESGRMDENNKWILSKVPGW